MESRSSYLIASAEALQATNPLPFRELVERVLMSGRVSPGGPTPRNTLFSLLWRASRRGYTVGGRRFRLYKRAGALWVSLEPRGRAPLGRGGSRHAGQAS
jgi:hypothetical protein